MDLSSKGASVQVALRIRPQGNREKLEGSRVCTYAIPNVPQVTIGSDRSFTYDFVFDQPTPQETVYDSCIEKLVEGLFDGFNATVLAYGQTGSGKTHTMGTGFDTGAVMEENIGVIPRAISHVFRKVVELKVAAQENGILEPAFDVAVQFIELYNEEIIDLLTDDRSNMNVRIHEDNRGEIYLHGATAKNVQDLHSTLEILKNGALNRTVASTNMNEQSSRSHAIFTLIIKQQRIVPVIEGMENIPTESEMEVLQAKFHFVDLAGSERLKRTGATGDRAKEGISINSGLLALGNVISALGGANGKVSHVPYRDSKLTRLLQDSLGGNSRTLMIACVSPSDSDFVETLNTMKYANRAKNIKNKVVANQDKSSKLIGELRSKIASLESELLEFKQGRRTLDENGEVITNDQYHENVLLTGEVNQLRFRVKALQETNEILRNRNVELMAAKDMAALTGITTNEGDSLVDGEEVLDPIQATVRKYLDELERMRSSLYESQATSDQLRKELQRWKNQAITSTGSSRPPTMGAELNFIGGMSSEQQKLIEEARNEIERLKKNSINSQDVTSDYASTGDNGEDADGEEDGTSNEADEIEEDSDEEEGSFEETKEAVLLRDNLNDLQNDISIKERLIEELEKSERRLAEVRLTYEKKLTELSLRIKQTEAERDRILAEGAEKQPDKASQEQAKRIREEYERKLCDMRNEFRKLQMIEKEHKRMQARQERERQELLKYQMELKDMKKNKVELMKKIREETKKAQLQQAANAKKLSAMDKDSRIKDNKIRQLESKDKQREMFMKRNQEEITRLRRAQKDQTKQSRLLSTPIRGSTTRFTSRGGMRTPSGRNQPPQQIVFSPKIAKIKWNTIEKKLSRLITQKQTVGKMEEELSKLLKERSELHEENANLEKKFISTKDTVLRVDINEQLDAIRLKLAYVQEQITDAQSAIVDLDANKDDETGETDTDNMSSTIEGILENCENIIEAKYLMQHLFENSLQLGLAAATSKASNRELEARVRQLEQQSFINEQLLSTVIEDKNLAGDLEYNLRRKSRSPSTNSLRTTDSASPSLADSSDIAPLDRSYKVRRRTATPDELLYPTMEPLNTGDEAKEAKEDKNNEEDEKKDKRRIVPLSKEASATHPPTFSRNNRIRSTFSGLPSKDSLKSNGTPTMGTTASRARGLTRMLSTSRLPSVSECSELPSTASIATPPSPREKDNRSVFARLIPTFGEASQASLTRKQGRIVAVKDSHKARVLTKTHSLEGHSKGVISVDSTEDLLLTGSKDRTAKLWDLSTGQEVCTLGVHPNSVNVVKFIAESNLAMTVSTYQIRIWDTRSKQCLRVLQSSGQVVEGDGGLVGSRQNTVPFLETLINAAAVDPLGRMLFTSCAGDVRIWSVKKWCSFGRLVGASHSNKSEVSCLSVANDDVGSPYIFTGSRDHYVKMYKVENEGGEGVHNALSEFSPPHYDNVTCTLAYNGHLYTASKDMNIMKFNLTDEKRDHLEMKAHNSYIQGMCLVGQKQGNSLLATVCKEGTVKLWDCSSTRRIRLVEEISKAHNDSINAVCSNSYMMFTPSSDHTVGFWKIN